MDLGDLLGVQDRHEHPSPMSEADTLGSGRVRPA